MFCWAQGPFWKTLSTPRKWVKNGFLAMSQNGSKVGKKWVLTNLHQLLHPKPQLLPTLKPIGKSRKTPLASPLCLEKANRTERTQQLAQRGNPKQNHHAHPMIWPSAAPNHIVVKFFLACDSQRRERGKIGIVIATEHSNQCVLLGGVLAMRCAGGG